MPTTSTKIEGLFDTVGRNLRHYLQKAYPSKRGIFISIIYQNMSTIHGRLWAHARDLIDRGIISDIERRRENLVIVPISVTRRRIEDLLEHDGILPPHIVNLSGVMTTSLSGISNLHFLFWPGVEKGLRVAVAGERTRLVQNILDRALTHSGIESIETTRIEHDQKMATIQALAHLLLIILWEQDNPDIQEKLIEPWKTGIETITDMIFENPFAEEVIIQFFESLRKNGNDPMKTFLQIVKKNLTDKDIKKFETPNFTRILEFNSDGKLTMEDDDIVAMRAGMNDIGKKFIQEKIVTIDQISGKKRK